MRVLSIPHAYSPVRGGAERYAQGVCEQLAARGHTVRVVVAAMASPEAFYGFGIPPVSAPEAETLGGVEVRRVPYGGMGYRLTGGLLRVLPARRRDGAARRWVRRYREAFTRRLAAEIEGFAPDVVLTLPHLFTNVRSVLDIQRDRGFPLVMVPLLHEEDPYWPFEEMREALGRAGAVIALTDHEAGRLVEGYGVDRAGVFTCPGGIDVPATFTDAAGREEVVVYLGRKSASKGIDRLVAAMRVVWTTRPRSDLVLAGRPDPGVDVESYLTALTATERARVTVVDEVADDDRDSLLRRARCLVLPSTNESFGLVVLEAWAHATPVVVADTPVLRETVTDGADGIVVDPADTAALGEAITRLLTDPERAGSMGRNGREKAARRFAWGTAGECAEAALAHAVAAAGGGSDG